MEILAKLGSSLSNFWWALDERERLLVIAAGATVAFALLPAAGGRRDVAAIADAVADRVAERLGDDGRR